MNSKLLNQFNEYYGDKNSNSRYSELLIGLNKIFYEKNINQAIFCAKTFLSKHVYQNIVSYKSINYNFQTIAAILIAFNVPLNQAEALFHAAGFYLNDSLSHCIVRFSIKNNLSLYDADDLLYTKTGTHFYKSKRQDNND